MMHVKTTHLRRLRHKRPVGEAPGLPQAQSDAPLTYEDALTILSGIRTKVDGNEVPFESVGGMLAPLRRAKTMDLRRLAQAEGINMFSKQGILDKLQQKFTKR